MRDCRRTGKLSFGTRDAALSRAIRWVKPGKYFRPYRCEFCGFWHLTSKAKQERNASER